MYPWNSILPYYNLIQFLIDTEGSMMTKVFHPLFATFPSAMISWDITIAVHGTTALMSFEIRFINLKKKEFKNL